MNLRRYPPRPQVNWIGLLLAVLVIAPFVASIWLTVASIFGSK